MQEIRRGEKKAERRPMVPADLRGGTNSVAPDGRADARLGVYLIPSQYRRNDAHGTRHLRRSRRMQGLAPVSNIADPPYKVTMRDNIATSCNGPDHMFRHVRCKHMIVAERLFRAPTRRSTRRVQRPMRYGT